MMQSFPLEPVPLENALHEVLTFCRPLAQTTNVNLALEGGDYDVSILSNPTRFGQIMINLVSNGIKYTKSGTTVMLSAKIMSLEDVDAAIDKAVAATQKVDTKLTSDTYSKNVAVISVTDCGDGLPQQAQTLFGKFAQLQNNGKATHLGKQSVGQSTGTGLGLSLCADFIERMRGRLWATSSDKGACFSFYCHIAEIPKNGQVSPNLLDAKSLEKIIKINKSNNNKILELKQQDFSKLKILVIDDTPINLKVLKRMLEGVGVKNVILAASGEEACETLKTESFDLVITDLQMPGMSGMELSDSIRRKEISFWKNQIQPVVVGLTAGASNPTLYYECAASGMSHVLHKPMTAVQMRDFLANCLPTLKPNDCSAGNLVEYTTN